jgi:acyl-CoA thioester hydrolase
VIVNTFCNYHVQLEYPGEIVARLYVANPGRSSFDKFVTLSRTDRPDVVYASGGATTVWVDLPKQKSVPLPQRLRELIGG